MCGGQHVVSIDCRRIHDRASFHDVFAEVFGFPDFYGRTMDPWIDCLTSLDSDFSNVRVAPGEIVVLRLDHARTLKASLPDVWADLIECAAFVNFRRLELGEPAMIALSFYN